MGHEDTELTCVNHPRTTTLVRCSNCNSPICVKCMNETPVGMKCPNCARVQFGRPADLGRRYAAGAAGLLAAALLGAAVVVLLGRFGFLTGVVLGLAVGALVRAVGRRRAGLGGIAAAATACGLALGVLGLGASFVFLFSPPFLFPALIAAAAAAFMASR
jgi:hypothetical protein